jgi:hypothetical protein
MSLDIDRSPLYHVFETFRMFLLAGKYATVQRPHHDAVPYAAAMRAHQPTVIML